MQAIAEGALQEAHAEDGEVRAALGGGGFRGVAVHRATALLLDEGRAPPDLALRFLPWLLSASPSDSLAVLKVPFYTPNSASFLYTKSVQQTPLLQEPSCPRSKLGAATVAQDG